MRISISIAARDRQFSKNFRKIRPSFDIFFSEFAAVQLVNPIHEAILIGITDSESEEYFKTIPNKDGYFQILAGVKNTNELEDLKGKVLKIIQKAILACPFSSPDKEQFSILVDKWIK